MLALNRHNPNPAVMMHRVCYALLPAIAVMTWQFGIGILINLLFASVLAVLSEALFLHLRRVPIKPFVTDGSVIISAWLIALTMPPCIPWPVIAVAILTATIVAKQLYGGLGNNIFNPAMVGYALAVLAFPRELTNWQIPIYQSFLDLETCLQCLAGHTPPLAQSGATPLAAWRFQLPLTGWNQTLWLYPNSAFLIGGLWLLYKRVIAWYIPVAFLVAVGVSTTFLYWINIEYPTPWFHLFSGASMIGAFFICTDPVTAPQHKIAMILFGGSIGLLLVLFRHVSSTIDGLAFAVLLMNMLTPLMNRWFPVPCKNPS